VASLDLFCVFRPRSILLSRTFETFQHLLWSALGLCGVATGYPQRCTVRFLAALALTPSMKPLIDAELPPSTTLLLPRGKKKRSNEVPRAPVASDSTVAVPGASFPGMSDAKEVCDTPSANIFSRTYCRKKKRRRRREGKNNLSRRHTKGRLKYIRDANRR